MPKQHLVIVLIMALLVAGCPASREELRLQPPSKAIFDSKKPPADVAGCISEAWQNKYAGTPGLGGAMVSTNPRPGGNWSITLQTGVWTSALLDISAAAGGSRLELVSDFSRGATTYSELIPACL